MSFAQDNSNRLNEDRNDIPGMQAMWCALLKAQWCMALNLPSAKDKNAPSPSDRDGGFRPRTGHMSQNRRMDMLHARDWFGGRDFRLVCDFAGIDSDYILEEFKRQVAA